MFYTHKNTETDRQTHTQTDTQRQTHRDTRDRHTETQETACENARRQSVASVGGGAKPTPNTEKERRAGAKKKTVKR